MRPIAAQVRFCLPVWGRHHVTGALAAVAVGRLLGFELAEMAAALANYQPMPMRCEVIEARGATIINDCYNSNPTAMGAALELLRELDAPGRRIVVCGDMGELGEQSLLLHWQLGKAHCGHRRRGSAHRLRAIRPARGRRGPGRRHEPQPRHGLLVGRSSRCAILGQAMLPGDVVLVKGSRMMAMERIIEALQHYPQRRMRIRTTRKMDNSFTTNYARVSPFALDLREFDATLPSLGRSINLVGSAVTGSTARRVLHGETLTERRGGDGRRPGCSGIYAGGVGCRASGVWAPGVRRGIHVNPGLTPGALKLCFFAYSIDWRCSGPRRSARRKLPPWERSRSAPRWRPWSAFCWPSCWDRG